METIKLNLIPSGVNPTCHAKQYDEGRVIRFELFEGLTPYTLQSGDTVTLNLRKPDNTIIESSVTATQGNKYVDLVTTEQMCACVGYNLGAFKLANGGVEIGTLNFIMAIERDVLADGIPSQSVIEDLDELVQEAVGDNYYTKTEVDDALDLKADKSTTYTKTEVDNKLADYYTKTEIDTALALKADKSELYNLLPTDTASGSIANFTDGADNIPVKSLVAQIVAQQAGSGDPSPSNVRPIIGASSLSVTRSGKNLMPSLFVGTRTNNGITYTVNADGTVSISGSVGTHNNSIQNYGHIILPAGTYTLSGNPDNVSTSQRDTAMILCKDGYSGSVNVIVSLYSNSTQPKATFTLTEPTDCYLRLYCYPIAGTYPENTMFKPMIEAGSIKTEFESCKQDTKTIDLGQTVYGGELDVKNGTATITYGIYTFDGTETWADENNHLFSSVFVARKYGDDIQSISDKMKFYGNGSTTVLRNGLSNNEYGFVRTNTRIWVRFDDCSTTAEVQAKTNGITVLYPLATPIILTGLTAEEIKTLLGTNNIFADTGDVEVNYRADIGLYIDKKISQIPTNLSSLSSIRSSSPDVINEEDPAETPTNDDEER